MAEWATETEISKGSTQHALCVFSRSCVPSYARLTPLMRFLCNFIPVTGSLSPSSSQQEIFSWLWKPVFRYRFVRQKKLHHLAFGAPIMKISLCSKKSIGFFYAIRYRNMPFSYLCLWFILWSISLVRWHLVLHKRENITVSDPKKCPVRCLWPVFESSNKGWEEEGLSEPVV